MVWWWDYLMIGVVDWKSENVCSHHTVLWGLCNYFCSDGWILPKNKPKAKR